MKDESDKSAKRYYHSWLTAYRFIAVIAGYDMMLCVPLITADQLSRCNILAMINRIRVLDQFIDGENGKAFMPAWRRVHSIVISEQSKSETVIYPASISNLFVDANRTAAL